MSPIAPRLRLAVILLGPALLLPGALRAQGADGARPAAATPSARPPASVAHADSVYFEFQVEKPVAPLPGARPVYPAPLSAAHITGSVLVQFVVDTLGRPEPASLKVLKASNALFVDAVRAALPAMRFRPAELHGHAVRQLVQQPFVFTLD